MPEFDFEAAREYLKSSVVYFGRVNGKFKIIQFMQAALFASEKRIKKKPQPHKVDADFVKIRNAQFKNGVTIYKCPDCGAFISKANSFCHECGKAIDWS